MSTEISKGEKELEVFMEFLEKSKLPINPVTVEKRLPPEPDIFCQTDSGQCIAFELVEICDRKLAKAINDASSEYIRTSDPSFEIFTRKLMKTYPVAYQIDLLAYTAGRVVTPDDCIIPRIVQLIGSREHVFKRVWLLGMSGLHCIWSDT